MATALLKRLGRREKRSLLLAAAVGIIYLIVSYLVLPGLNRFRLNGRLIEEKKVILAGYHETLEKEKVLQRRLQVLDGLAAGFDKFLLSGDKPALAAASLQNRVKEAAQRHGLDITSEKIAAPRKEDIFTVIPVEITAGGSVASLRDFLFDLESGSPRLAVAEISIQNNKKRTFDAASKRYLDVEELRATMLISGMMRGEG